MPPLKSPTALERVTGNVATESALTYLASWAGGPLAALLPVLSKSLASERQKARVEQTLVEINQILEKHDAEIRNLSDEQYKIINEAVLALLQATQAEKLNYLRTVVQNSLTLQDVLPQEAIALSRAIREISVQEVKFLMENFHYKNIMLIPASAGAKTSLDIIQIEPTSQEALVVSGLLSLGLLTPAQATIDNMGMLCFSEIVAKLIALLRTP